MPIRFLKRLSPRRSQLANRWFLRPFGALVHDPSLWRLDRHNAARALAIGLFCAWMPVPSQMALAALVAVFVRVHLPLAVATVWVSNPVTSLPMFYLAYRLGLWILGIDPGTFQIGLSFEWALAEFYRIWEPLLLGCFLLGAISAVVGYFALDLLWHWTLVRKYRRIQAAGRRRVSRELMNR